jgi:hypothetical protein
MTIDLATRELNPSRMSQARTLVGDGKRAQPDHSFAGDVEGLTAGGQHPGLCTPSQNRLDQLGHRVEEVLAVV